MRIQVQPFCQFGRDVAWITQDVIERYIYASFKGDARAELYLSKASGGDPIRMRTFREVVITDPDYEDLYAQLWDEAGLPAPGSIEYHILMIEQRLAGNIEADDAAKLYKILGEYRGWLTKPGDKAPSVHINVGSEGSGIEGMRNMNAKDAERVYFSMISAVAS